MLLWLRFSQSILSSRDIDDSAGTNVLATRRELGVAVVAAIHLERGMLTPAYISDESVDDSVDMRPLMMSRFLDDNRERNAKVAAQGQELADKKGFTVAQLALSWLLKQEDDIFVIPGVKRLRYMEENRGAVDVTLTDEEEAEIRWQCSCAVCFVSVPGLEGV